MSSPVILALDFDSKDDALKLLNKINPAQCRIKIGKGMFTRFGPQFVKQVVGLNFDVFLDLKFHDIPNTVYDACRAAGDLGVWMINVHASGGADMLAQARKAVDNSCQLIAVTILTSLQQSDLSWMQSQLDISEIALALAQLSQENGLDGVVASAFEANAIKQKLGRDFKVISPGIRLSSDSNDDQKRIMTPVKARQQGVDYLVIGRSITQSQNPYQTVLSINASIS